MQVWSLLGQKGGCGKTTIALHLAVEAAYRGRRVALWDLDPQASCMFWADRREDFGVDIDVMAGPASRITQLMEMTEQQGYDLAVLDTAPHATGAVPFVVAASDIVIVPCRPAILDLDSIALTLNLTKHSNTPTTVLLNAAPVRSRVTMQARKVITRLGARVCDVVIHERVAFKHALVDGRTAREFQPESIAAAEIKSLYGLLAEQRPRRRAA